MPNSRFLLVDSSSAAVSASHSIRKYLSMAIAILLLSSATVLSSGCAANKCDCPKFGGHHLSH